MPLTDGLKQQKYILFLFWRSVVLSQGVSRTILPPMALGKDSSLSLAMLGAPGHPWYFLVYISITPIPTFIVTSLSLCVGLCVSSPLL